jgi:hypothetical protein
LSFCFSNRLDDDDDDVIIVVVFRRWAGCYSTGYIYES